MNSSLPQELHGAEAVANEVVAQGAPQELHGAEAVAEPKPQGVGQGAELLAWNVVLLASPTLHIPKGEDIWPQGFAAFATGDETGDHLLDELQTALVAAGHESKLHAPCAADQSVGQRAAGDSDAFGDAGSAKSEEALPHPAAAHEFAIPVPFARPIGADGQVELFTAFGCTAIPASACGQGSLESAPAGS